MEYSWQEYCSGLPFPSQGDLSNSGMKLGSPALQADALLSEPPGKPTPVVSDLQWHWPKSLGPNVIFLLIPSSSCSVAKQRLTLCDPMDCTMPGFPVLHISRSLLKFISTESVMPSNYLIFCCLLHLILSIFPSSRVFSNELAVCIRWPKYWSFSSSIGPSNECLGLIFFWSPCSPRDSQESSPEPQFESMPSSNVVLFFHQPPLVLMWLTLQIMAFIIS